MKSKPVFSYILYNTLILIMKDYQYYYFFNLTVHIYYYFTHLYIQFQVLAMFISSFFFITFKIY